jgi:hypothetical protein
MTFRVVSILSQGHGPPHTLFVYRTVYDQLSQVGDLEQQAMCRERVEELEPSIRYCQYNLNKSGGKTNMSDLKDLKSQSPAQDLLQVTSGDLC